MNKISRPPSTAMMGAFTSRNASPVRRAKMTKTAKHTSQRATIYVCSVAGVRSPRMLETVPKTVHSIEVLDLVSLVRLSEWTTDGASGRQEGVVSRFRRVSAMRKAASGAGLCATLAARGGVRRPSVVGCRPVVDGCRQPLLELAI
jgi:hypothetical protein